MHICGTGDKDGATSYAVASAKESIKVSNLEKSMENGHVQLNQSFLIIFSGKIWEYLL